MHDAMRLERTLWVGGAYLSRFGGALQTKTVCGKCGKCPGWSHDRPCLAGREV